MRRILTVGLSMLVAVVVVLELTAPQWVAAGIESRVHEGTEQRVGIEADVSGPPLLIPALVSGDVAWAEFEVTEVLGRELPVELTIRLEDVVVDRASLFGPDTRLREVGHATARLVADLGADVPEALRPLADRLANAGVQQLLERTGAFGLRAEGEGIAIGDDLQLDLKGGIEGCETTVEDLVLRSTCVLVDVPELFVRLLSQ